MIETESTALRGPILVRIIAENEVNDDVAILDRAWDDAETFVFAPDKIVAPGSPTAKWLTQAVAAVPEEVRTGHFALFTSGTTGQPKLVVGERRRSEALVETLHQLQDSEPARSTVIALPLTYSYAFINQWLWSRRFERKRIPTPGLGHADQLRESLAAAEDAMLCLVGVQVALLERYFAGESFPGIIRVHFAGGRFPQEKLELIGKMFPEAQVFNNYGCAEAMPRLTLRRANDAREAANIGRPLPGVQLASSEADELMFRSRYGAVGFVGDVGFIPIGSDDWVKTGDLGKPNEDGTWRLTGRASEVFKRHGEKISLAAVLSTVHSAWHGQAAFYREADRNGEDGAVLVLAPVPEEPQVRAVLLALRKQHPRAHWPLRIESLDQIPMLPNGKVDRDALRNGSQQTRWAQRI